MIDITSKKCVYENCTIRPSYNYENEKQVLYCKTHKLYNMIAIKSKKCIYENCIKQPAYNYKNEKQAIYCTTHKLDNMIDIKNKRCIFENCIKQPAYNYKNEKQAIYCTTHKLDNMIDIKNKRCIFENCNIIPVYNYENKKQAIYCATHKLDNMIDIKSKKCITFNCTIRYQNKFKGYCLRCFIYNFPDSKIIRDYGTREAKVSEFIKESYNNLNITYNKQIDGGCSNHRPDIFIDCLTHSVIIEVDEHQHKNGKSYNPECELRRLNNLFTDLADRPIVFIRFNPDSYTNKKNKLIKSCFEYTEDKGLPKSNKTLQNRLEKLKEVIDENLNKAPNENITIRKLYYDET